MSRVLAVFLLFVLELSGTAFAQEDTTILPHLPTHSIHINQEDYSQSEGVSFKAILVNDSWGTVRGGEYRGVGSVGNVNLILEIDTERLGWWERGRFLFYGLGVYGRRPSLSVGDYQYTSSIDAFETVEPFEIFYEHHFDDRGTNVLVGIHDFSTEFAVLESAASLINSSFATPATITQLPYSFYPFTGLGARALLPVAEESYFMAGVYDGRPASQRRARSIDIGLSGDDGAYSIVEVGHKSSEGVARGKIALGAWYNSGLFTDMNGEYRGANYGSYLIGEQQLLPEDKGSAQGLGMFLQLGYAPSDRNFNPWYGGFGLRYLGLLDGRPDDALALGFNVATISQYYRSANPNTDLHERGIELGYRCLLSDWLTLTPDVQFVANPGGRGALSNATIFFVRSEITL